MTVRKRLFWSNILMILVPVIATALIGILCVGILWVCVVNGTGLELDDTEDFSRVCLAMTETMEHALDKEADLTAFNPLLENNGMTAQVVQGDREVYNFGDTDARDAALRKAAQALPGSCLVSQNGRSLYKSDEMIQGVQHTVYIFGSDQSTASYADLKAALATCVLLISFTIFLSILLTNRFLTKFVFRRIEEPLDILTNGVHEIRDGNLDFHIDYDHADEFQPVCEAFNEMAVRLKASVTKQQQERSRKELLAGISHDIRSPLTCVQAYVEGLLDGVAKTLEAQKGYLTTIKTKAEDLDGLVSRLFLFSKLELGEYLDDPRRLRLDERVEALVSEAKAEYQEKGLLLETDLAPVTVTADPLQIERMVNNIMENSLKYKTKETGRLRISLAKAGSRCLLTFDDDGPGVPEDALTHLFEVFYRGDPARQNPQNGSGLGLGADDYIEKPFSPSVLVAWVKANLAQYQRLTGKKQAPSEITLGSVRINTGTRRVFVEDKEIKLKNREYELLLFLMLNVDLVFDRETLYEKVWGLDAMGDNATVAVHINRLREKIERDPSKPRYIETVWGAGYRFRG